MTAKATVVTVNLNDLEGLKMTLPTVLAQTYRPLEYVLIDGNSSDRSAEYIAAQKEHFLAAGIEYKYVSEPDDGIYDAMNKGVKLATGEWINFMNSRDCFYNSAALAALMAKTAAAGIVYGAAEEVFNPQLCNLVKPSPLTWLPYLPMVSHQATITRTELLRQRPYNLRYSLSAEYEFLLHLYRKGGSIITTDIPVARCDRNGRGNQNKLRQLAQVARAQLEHRDSWLDAPLTLSLTSVRVVVYLLRKTFGAKPVIFLSKIIRR